MREVAEGRVERSPEAFDAFYLREYRAVVALAYALSGNRWTAEDVAQDAFLAVHRDWLRIAMVDDPGAWVRRIVSNLCVSAFRRRLAEANALGRIAARRPPPISELPAEDAEFWRCVRSLPRRQAQVIALHYVEDLGVADIAGILEIAEGTVKKHLFDGRRALARSLDLREDDR